MVIIWTLKLENTKGRKQHKKYLAFNYELSKFPDHVQYSIYMFLIITIAACCYYNTGKEISFYYFQFLINLFQAPPRGSNPVGLL